MSYGTVTVEDSGQQITGNNDSKYEEIQIDYKFQVYDPGGTIDAVAREKRVVCKQNSKKMLHIKVKSDGYYQFRIYSDDKKDLTGSKLTMYVNAPKRNSTTLSLSKYIETTYSDCDTFRTLVVGDFEYDLEKHIRYSARCFLTKDYNYYAEYEINGVEKFNLIFGVCSDQIQYDVPNPVGNLISEDVSNWNSAENEYGVMLGDTVIAPCLNNDSLQKLFHEEDYPYYNITKGMFCGVMWEVDTGCRKSGPYTYGEYGALIYHYKTPIKILYLDQMLGGWLYNKMDFLYDKIKDSNEKKDKADAFKKGMLESSAAAAGGWATQSLLELGACAGLATPASIVVGLLITAMFLTADGANDKTPFEKFLQKFRGYVAGSVTRFALSTPVVILIGTQHELTSPAPDTVFYDVYPWDGTTVSAVGGQFYYGRYAYCYTCENDLATAYSVLNQAMTGEPEGN